MSQDLIETLWREFAAETGEHLDLMEPLLVDAETAGGGAEAVAQLFRSMHSIKGPARAMELRRMEGLSHAAESLLGLVRKGRARLDASLAGPLLEVVDALKRMRATAVAEHADATAPDALLRRLDALAAALDRIRGADAMPEDLAAAALDRGEHAHVIIADLDADPVIAERFVGWLGEAGRAVTNRTLFDGESSRFEFLVLSARPGDAVAADLAAIDPTGDLLALAGRGAHAQEAAAVRFARRGACAGRP